jgi:hypothetical protein
MHKRSCFALLSVACLLFGPSAADARGTMNRIALFAQDWNGYPADRSKLEWKAAAKHHLLLVGTPGPVYGKRISQLHSWNPRLKVVAYDLGPYTVKGTPLYDRLIAAHPGYFARDANGQLITVKAASGSPSFPDNTLMDPGIAGWRAVQAKRVARSIHEYGFDGAYIDSMGLGVFTGATTAVPVDRATSSAYTKKGWLKAEAQSLNKIRSVIGRRFLFCNGLVNGIVYEDYTHILAESHVDGIMTDSWMRLASAPVTAYPSPALFRANLRMVRGLQAHGKYFFGWTKLWTSASDAQKHAWDRFALASYLLVKGTKAMYTFTPTFDVDRTKIYDRLQRAKLGAPLHRFTVSNGVYRRRFENGRVTVDPSTHKATIRLNP